MANQRVFFFWGPSPGSFLGVINRTLKHRGAECLGTGKEARGEMYALHYSPAPGYLPAISLDCYFLEEAYREHPASPLSIRNANSLLGVPIKLRAHGSRTEMLQGTLQMVAIKIPV